MKMSRKSVYTAIFDIPKSNNREHPAAVGSPATLTPAPRPCANYCENAIEEFGEKNSEIGSRKMSRKRTCTAIFGIPKSNNLEQEEASALPHLKLQFFV